MVIRPEDFNARFETLASSLDGLAAEVLGDDLAVGAAAPAASKARTALRAYLADEIIPAVLQDGDLTIRATEAAHEQMKRALAHLKLSVLRDIARQRGIDATGDLDRVTNTIASALDWNSQTIAQLILDHTEQSPEVTAGHSTRVFTTRKTPPLETIAADLSYVSGRYIRTGIARWFVFGASEQVAQTLRVNGAVDGFRAEARELDSTVFLDATPTSSDVRLELPVGFDGVLVHDTSAQDARAALLALQATSTVTIRDYVPRTGSNMKITAGALHATSQFMLDLLYSRLKGNLFRERNPILARFKYSELRPAEDGTRRKPRLRAVRFDGEHLLDSREACSLLWREGRPLVDVTMRVKAHDENGQPWGDFNVRVTIENDHVAVTTSYGAAPVAQSLRLHQAGVAAVQQALVGDDLDWDRLSAVENHVRMVATSPNPPETAELLRDLNED